MGPEGCGLTAVVNARQTCTLGRPAPYPGLPSSEALVWVLKQELRLELLHWVPSAGVQTGWEEHDFLFATLDHDIILADLFIWEADLAHLHKGKSLG